MKWGSLIQAALDAGLDCEDAVYAVLAAAHRIEQEGLGARLTPGELRALVAVGEHGSYQQAADALGIAKSTVHRQVKMSARKLGVRMGDATAEAGRLGLLDREAA